MNSISQFATLLITLLFSLPIVAQEACDDFPCDLYQPSTISALAKEAGNIKANAGQSTDPNATVIIPVERFPLRLEFVGDEVRPLGKENKTILAFIEKVFPHIPTEQWATYTHEIHVKEDAIDLWLPIQGQILKTLIPVLLPGMKFDAYVFWLGEKGGQQICVINTARTFKQ
jgi:hypothetical protein